MSTSAELVFGQALRVADLPHSDKMKFITDENQPVAHVMAVKEVVEATPAEGAEAAATRLSPRSSRRASRKREGEAAAAKEKREERRRENSCSCGDGQPSPWGRARSAIGGDGTDEADRGAWKSGYRVPVHAPQSWLPHRGWHGGAVKVRRRQPAHARQSREEAKIGREECCWPSLKRS